MSELWFNVSATVQYIVILARGAATRVGIHRARDVQAASACYFGKLRPYVLLGPYLRVDGSPRQLRTSPPHVATNRRRLLVKTKPKA
jgi:hypothetical protein